LCDNHLDKKDGRSLFQCWIILVSQSVVICDLVQYFVSFNIMYTIFGVQLKIMVNIKRPIDYY